MKLIKKIGLCLLGLSILVAIIHSPLTNALSSEVSGASEIPEVSGESSIPQNISQPEVKVPISVFERKTCPHCKAEKAFLQKLEKERNDIEVLYHDIDDPEHKVHFDKLTEIDNLPKVTPLTLVGNMVLQGFYNEETTGKRIIEIVEQSKGKNTLNFTEYIRAGGKQKIENVYNSICEVDQPQEECAPKTGEFIISLPLIGEVDLESFSLPVLSLVLGFIDGFNPCAMWVLIVFLTVLLQAGSKEKMMRVAGIFIVAEAIMYYLILNVWLTTWDFVGLDEFITPIVGMIAIGGGAFFLYQFYKDDGTCKVVGHEQRKKTTQKIHDLVTSPFTILTFLGIIGLALSVNIIEFACSIGIPQAFTKVLDLNPLPFLKRELYMFLYVIMYMVDDVIVFSLAIWGFATFGLTAQKYAKWCHLIGGLLMFILGALLIFAPEMLVFQ